MKESRRMGSERQIRSARASSMMSRTKVEVQNRDGRAVAEKRRLKIVNKQSWDVCSVQYIPGYDMSCVSADADELGPDRSEPRGDEDVLRVVAERSAI